MPLANRVPTHPGEMLLEEFLAPWRETAVAFAARSGVPLEHITELIAGKRGVSADMAVKLAVALGTSAEFWINLQAAHGRPYDGSLCDGTCIKCGHRHCHDHTGKCLSGFPLPRVGEAAPTPCPCPYPHGVQST